MKGIFSKIKKGIALTKIGAAVGKTVITGKGSKTLEKVDKYSELAEYVLSGLELAKELVKK